jgi:hypothetical protein
MSTVDKTLQHSTPMSDCTTFKDCIDRDAVSRHATAAKAAEKSFKLDAFLKSAMKGLSPLEFTGRMQRVADADFTLEKW